MRDGSAQSAELIIIARIFCSENSPIDTRAVKIRTKSGDRLEWRVFVSESSPNFRIQIPPFSTGSDLEQFLSDLTIVEVAKDTLGDLRVQPRPINSNYYILCPYHSEKLPRAFFGPEAILFFVMAVMSMAVLYLFSRYVAIPLKLNLACLIDWLWVWEF